MTAAEYYDDAQVRGRILEFCGARPGGPPTAAFVAVLNPEAGPFATWDAADRLAPADIPWPDGRDVSCSLWDTTRLVFFIEIDYLNVDRPDEPFRHPADTLVALEPTCQAVRTTLSSLGLHVRVFVSGRGYHFLGGIPLGDPVVDRLAALVPTTPGWWAGWEARRAPGVTASLPARQARAAEGLGLLIEYVGHLSLRDARRASPLPVVFNGTTVGSGLNGRAAVSIDFSHLGDPLDVRHVRAGFSTYQWHRIRADIFGSDVASGVPALAVVPRSGNGLVDLISGGRSLDAARVTAQTASAVLPDVSAGIARLIDRYLPSPLARFHSAFLPAASVAGPAEEPRGLPPCAMRPLDRPNDLLLQPAFVQHLTRVLLSRGWEATDVARLVRSRYEAEFGWGDRWTRGHAATRAAFDVRVFAGMIETGLDTLVDFNCVSAQEKDVCPRIDCVLNLEHDRDRLRSRWRA